VDPDAKPVIAKRHKNITKIDAALFPGQELPSGLNAEELCAICGLHQGINNEAKRKKGMWIKYEADPDMRDFENIPLSR